MGEYGIGVHYFDQVMTAASYWSLLSPAIQMAEESGVYGKDGQWAFAPVAVGFVLGALSVFGADRLIPYLVSWGQVDSYLSCWVQGR